MSFDFDKCINGGPTYYDGKKIEVCWYPKTQRFAPINKMNTDLIGICTITPQFDKNGYGDHHTLCYGQLSTDPPKEKVKLNIYYYIANQAERTTGRVFYAREVGKLTYHPTNAQLLTTIEVEL